MATKATDETTKHETLAGALCAMMGEIGVIAKTVMLPVTSTLKVPVAGIEDLTKAIQPLAAKHGVVLMPKSMEHETEVIGQTRNGSDTFRTIATVTWLIAHRDSPETYECQTIGMGNDSGDKAAYSAMTGAEKYAWRLILCIATDNDPDAKQSTETTGGQRARGGSSGQSFGPPKNPAEPISEPQRKRMYAIVKSVSEKSFGGKLDETTSADVKQCVESVLSKAGFDSSKAVTKGKYEAVVKDIESAVARLVLGPGAEEPDPSGATDSDPIPNKGDE